MTGPPYNPLDKINLAKSIEAELLGRPEDGLGAIGHVVGAGVYAIYYSGPFSAYSPIASKVPKGQSRKPIYVGKAIPKGGRKGGLVQEAVSATGRALAERLRNHASSVSEASNLDLKDFSVRHLVVDDIWIPLGENVLIETFQPVWNIALDGFGNKTPGARRATQYRSQWDVIHPGRRFATKLADLPVSAELLFERIDEHFAGKPLTKLPKVVEEQVAKEATEAEEAADEV